MKTKKNLLNGVVIGIGLTLGTLMISSFTSIKPNTNLGGQYQLEASGGNLYLLNTTTSTVYQLSSIDKFGRQTQYMTWSKLDIRTSR